MKALILENLNEAREVLEEFVSQPKNIEAIEKAAAIMVEAVQNGGKIISCGNGGSMTDAMHFAEELSGVFREKRPALIPLILHVLPMITVSMKSSPGTWRAWVSRAMYSWPSAPAATP